MFGAVLVLALVRALGVVVELALSLLCILFWFCRGCVALRGNRSGLQSKCTTSSYVSARAAVGYKSGIAVFTFKITSSSNSYLSFGVAKDDNGGDYRER